ncbi:hypothetical protein V8C34DRAFT_293428 [Trichoderma compactum]
MSSFAARSSSIRSRSVVHGQWEDHGQCEVASSRQRGCTVCRMQPATPSCVQLQASWIGADKDGKYWMSVEKWSTYTVKLFSGRVSIGSFQILHRSKGTLV